MIPNIHPIFAQALSPVIPLDRDLMATIQDAHALLVKRRQSGFIDALTSEAEVILHAAIVKYGGSEECFLDNPHKAELVGTSDT